MEGYDRTFFGDPDGSPTWVEVNAVTALVEHQFAGGLQLRNRTRYADYDKLYQNVFPGAVNAEVTLKTEDGLEVVAIVTQAAVAELALTSGACATALVKASDVILAVVS